MPSSPHLPDSALPGLFQDTDAASIAAQRRFLRASRSRLLLLVAAAACGALGARTGRGAGLAAAGVAAALIGAVLVEAWLITARAERTWYDGRALAESAKTLAWRYAVAGAPFDRPMSDQAAEQRLAGLLSTLVQDAPGPGIRSGPLPQVTDPMRELRAADLDRRRQVYLAERIESQARWYSSKARWNHARAARWRLALLATESAGVIVVVVGPGDLGVNLAGVVAAVVAAGVAWLSLKQHESLSHAYAYAANELSMARSRLGSVGLESEWAVEVDNAERAISREHTMWRAFRSTP